MRCKGKEETNNEGRFASGAGDHLLSRLSAEKGQNRLRRDGRYAAGGGVDDDLSVPRHDF
ncbi:hypothetical protein D1872_315440 [compost metagenome]